MKFHFLSMKRLAFFKSSVIYSGCYRILAFEEVGSMVLRLEPLLIEDLTLWHFR